MSICLSQKAHVQTSQKVLYMLQKGVPQSYSDNSAINYIFMLMWWPHLHTMEHIQRTSQS